MLCGGRRLRNCGDGCHAFGITKMVTACIWKVWTVFDVGVLEAGVVMPASACWGGMGLSFARGQAYSLPSRW